MTIAALVNLGTNDWPIHRCIVLHDLTPKPVVKAYRERSWRRADDERGLSIRAAVEVALKDLHGLRASSLIAWTARLADWVERIQH